MQRPWGRTVLGVVGSVWLEQSVTSRCLVGLFRSPRDDPDLPE